MMTVAASSSRKNVGHHPSLNLGTCKNARHTDGGPTSLLADQYPLNSTRGDWHLPQKLLSTLAFLELLMESYLRLRHSCQQIVPFGVGIRWGRGGNITGSENWCLALTSSCTGRHQQCVRSFIVSKTLSDFIIYEATSPLWEGSKELPSSVL